MDDELSDALEVLRSSTGAERLSLSSREEGRMHRRRTAEDQDQQSQHLATFHTPRTQRTLFSDDEDVKCLVEKDVQHERAVRSKHHSDDHSSRCSEPRSYENVAVYEGADERKEDNDDESARYVTGASDQNPKREDAVAIDEGA